MAKLRSGWVGRTQAVGMVLLGASSLLECSGCVCGSKGGCCGAGPSLTAAGEAGQKPQGNQRVSTDVWFRSQFHGRFPQEHTSLHLPEGAGDT